MSDPEKLIEEAATAASPEDERNEKVLLEQCRLQIDLLKEAELPTDDEFLRAFAAGTTFAVILGQYGKLALIMGMLRGESSAETFRKLAEFSFEKLIEARNMMEGKEEAR